MSKLALGSVQFGVDYGVSSTSGQPEINEVKKILSYAHSKGINTIDTAFSYGNSEQVLGELNISDFKIVTKTRNFIDKDINREELILIEKDFHHSIQNLKLESTYGLLIHNSEDLLKLNGDKLFNQLNKLKQDGKVKKIGVSVYEYKHLQMILDNFDIDIVQLPLNILDRRMIENRMLAKLKKRGIEVHARSIFLQGLLLMSKHNRPKKFDRWNNIWKIWHDWLNNNQITAIEAAIKFALSVSEISKVLVGVETKSQLEEIVTASTSDTVLPEIPAELYTCDTKLLNPMNWSKL